MNFAAITSANSRSADFNVSKTTGISSTDHCLSASLVIAYYSNVYCIAGVHSPNSNVPTPIAFGRRFDCLFDDCCETQSFPILNGVSAHANKPSWPFPGIGSILQTCHPPLNSLHRGDSTPYWSSECKSPFLETTEYSWAMDMLGEHPASVHFAKTSGSANLGAM